MAQGVHPRVVMEILGHSAIALTMNTYSHVLPQAQRDAADLLDSLLGGAAAGDQGVSGESLDRRCRLQSWPVQRRTYLAREAVMSPVWDSSDTPWPPLLVRTDSSHPWS